MKYLKEKNNKFIKYFMMFQEYYDNSLIPDSLCLPSERKEFAPISILKKSLL